MKQAPPRATFSEQVAVGLASIAAPMLVALPLLCQHPVILPLVLSVLLVAPADSVLAAQLTAVLASAPVERLESINGATKILGALETDLDRDGTTEAIAWVRPALRQTPTLLVFRRKADGTGWERIVEGLAPGRLRAVSGQLEDTHVHRVAVDLVAGDGSRASNARVLGAAASTGMSLVAYDGFLHGDTRVAARFVIDLSAWALPKGTDNTCEKFEFSQPVSVVVGSIGGDSASSYLAALTEQDITVYRIRAIAADGRLSVESWMQPKPRGARELALDASGNITVIGSEGHAPLSRPDPPNDG
jgi:hypothetical protein